MEPSAHFVARGVLSRQTHNWPVSSLALPEPKSRVLRELQELLNERLLLRLGIIRTRLSEMPGVPGAGRATEWIERLMKWTPSQRRPVLESPRFGAWLEKTTCLVNSSRQGGSKEATVAELSEHLQGLTLMILPLAFRDFELRSGSYPVRLVRRYAPIGICWRLEPVRPHGSAEIRLEFHAGGVRFREGGSILADVPATAFDPMNDGGEILLGAQRRVSVAVRGFVAGSIEIGAIQDYPELVEEWRMPDAADDDLAIRSIEGGLSKLEEVWPAAFADVRHFCRLVTPVLAAGSRRRSSTHPNLLFTQMVTVNRGGNLEHAEDMLHESSHSKLWCMRRVDPLTKNGHERRFRHPWRSDLRPIMGVFAGAHAFLAVMELYLRARRLAPIGAVAEARLENLTREVGQALQVLESAGEFTDNGDRVKNAMVAAYNRLTTSR